MGCEECIGLVSCALLAVSYMGFEWPVIGVFDGRGC